MSIELPPDHVHKFKYTKDRQSVCACGVNAKDECTWGHKHVEGSFSVVSGTGVKRCKKCANRRAKERNDKRTAERHEADKERQRNSSKTLRDSRRKQVFDHYGWACACCGENTVEFLCLDHVNGGGNQHRKELTGHRIGSHPTYRWAIENGFPDIFQTLCYNCNFAKHAYGACPHQG